MNDKKTFIIPEAEIIELFDIDTVGESGEQVSEFDESQLPQF